MRAARQAAQVTKRLLLYTHHYQPVLNWRMCASQWHEGIKTGCLAASEKLFNAPYRLSILFCMMTVDNSSLKLF